MGAAIFFAFVLITSIVIVTIIGYMVYGMYLGLASLARLCRQLWLQAADRNRQQPTVAICNVAEQHARTSGERGTSGEHCWEIKQCSPTIRQLCPAYHRPEVPCWQAWMEANQDAPLRPKCLTCKMFNLTTLMS